jgi:thiamine kinase-like enzyme
VGAALAALQRVGFAGSAPEDPWYVEPVGAARWHELADGLAAAGGPFAAELAALVDELVALEALLAPPRSLATCHRDLWADNVLPVRGGGLCVIDWDNCGLADPAGELAHVLVEFAAGDDARVRALDAAYREAGGRAAPRRAG